MTDELMLALATEDAPEGGFQFYVQRPLPRVLTPEQCAAAAGELLTAVAQPRIQEAHPGLMTPPPDGAPRPSAAEAVARVSPDDVLAAVRKLAGIYEQVAETDHLDADHAAARDELLTLLGRYFAEHAAELTELVSGVAAPLAAVKRRHALARPADLPEVVVAELEADPDCKDGSKYTHESPDGQESYWTRENGVWVMDGGSTF